MKVDIEEVEEGQGQHDKPTDGAFHAAEPGAQLWG